ncbi:hypothetical protein BC940DRAFT_318242 [Gongronella butleri]|nr:hypothetical protein BC940DRAFT_318242 [Gongronella butleri]
MRLSVALLCTMGGMIVNCAATETDNAQSAPADLSFDRLASDLSHDTIVFVSDFSLDSSSVVADIASDLAREAAALAADLAVSLNMPAKDTALDLEANSTHNLSKRWPTATESVTVTATLIAMATRTSDHEPPGFLTWLLLTLAEPKGGYPMQGLVYVAAAVGGGAVAGFVSLVFWKFALPSLGMLAGTFFGFYLFLWREDHVIINGYARVFTCVGMGIFMFVGAYLIESMVVVLSTSFLGAFFLVLGLDVLLHTGLAQAIRAMFDVNPYTKPVVYHLDHKLYGMLSAILVVFVLGTLLQSYRHHGCRFGISFVLNKDPI